MFRRDCCGTNGWWELFLGQAFESCTVYQKNVGPPVVVIIKNSHASSGGLDDVLLGVLSAEDVGHRQTGLFRGVSEVGDRRGLRRGERTRCEHKNERKCSLCQSSTGKARPRRKN